MLDDYNDRKPFDSRIHLLLAQKEPVILLTIIDTQGSVARKAGTRAIYTAVGLEGTVGGGLFEARLLEEAAMCLAEGSSRLFAYAGHDDAGRGHRTALCELLNPNLASLFFLASATIKDNQRGAWLLDLTDPEEPKRSLILEDEPLEFTTDWNKLLERNLVTVNGQLLANLLQRAGGKAQQIKDGSRLLYVEPLKIPAILLILGGGHVALTTAELASKTGFCVDLIDSRIEMADKSRFPMANEVIHLPDYANILQNYPITQQHYVVIMTHDHDSDLNCLSQMLQSKAAYIGMLGGSFKRQAIFSALREQGIPDTELACIHTPVGLNIGAETPEEIAVSIVAELVAAKSGTLGQLR